MFEIVDMQSFFRLIFFFFDAVKFDKFEIQPDGSCNNAYFESYAVDLVVNGNSIDYFLHFLLGS